MSMLIQVGDDVQVKAYKADGTCYRRWRATVEAVEADKVVLSTPAGHCVEDLRGTWISKHAIRVYCWSDRWYCLSELYKPDGRLAQIYVNINSPIEVKGSQISFTDYELDVSRMPPDEAHVVDEDEFEEAAVRYGYTETFQETCYRVVREAVDVANHWVPKGMPQL